MVRINLVSPELLSDQHLIAEYHEIGMLLGYINKHPSLNKIPEVFSLGTGHIRFFKNKLQYLYARSNKLITEMKKRGFNVIIFFDFSIYEKEYFGGWEPKKDDYNIIIDRISERLLMKPDWYRYNGNSLGSEGVKKLIKRMENIYL